MRNAETAQPENRASSASAPRPAAAIVPTRLQQVGLVLALALGALLLLSACDIRCSVSLLHSAATCWPGRIRGQRSSIDRASAPDRGPSRALYV